MKTMFITGASRGIGRAVAFAAAGRFNIVAVYNKSAEEAESLVAEIKKKGAAAIAVKADVANYAEVLDAYERAVKAFGGVDVVVTAAGIAEQKLFTDITEADWRRMFDVNVTGTRNALAAALPAMISKKRGKLITIASVWGETGASCEVHYSASKAAVIGLTKALAKEVGLSGIEVNCVSPGAVKTDMLAGFSAADLAALAADTPLNRLGTPEDVAAAVMFFAENAAFITGAVLAVNGGFHI
ncbi:MAG: SDR family oxidoreductase [Clostridiaceae bacterium]|jgi:3-oxoacyl-[acyl-carrier protein] reductase|nr:SDR family oxidoreductase [Clostridiaceae bacterium]